jgi:preprotein translocase SecE subunit
MGLVVSSIIGAVVVLAAVALVLRGIPALSDGLANSIGIHDYLVRVVFQVILQMAAVVGLVYLASKIGVGQIAQGLRGGIFLMVGVGFLGCFALAGLYRSINHGFSAANIVVMLFYVVIVFLLVQLFRTGKFTQWSMIVDRAGWFDTHTHKRTQGLLVRRLTIFGILLVAGTGIWTLSQHGYLARNQEITMPNGEKRSNRLGDWVVFGDRVEAEKAPEAPKASASDAERAAYDAKREEVRIENRARPRVDNGITLLPDLEYTVPLILIVASLWLAWRTVNHPTFADFLIATQAEINKVSWTPRRALIRDALVVLVSLVLVTIFLFVVDLFWSAVLSSRYIAVLPTEKEQQEASKGSSNPKPVQDW